MNEKEAREIDRRNRRMDIAVRPEAHVWIYAQGYLAGLKDEREHVRPLIERLTVFANALPPNAISMNVGKALAAYQHDVLGEP